MKRGLVYTSLLITTMAGYLMYLTGLTDNEIIIVASIYVVTSILNVGLYIHERNRALLTVSVLELVILLGCIFGNYLYKIIYYTTEELLPLLIPALLGVVFSFFVNKNKPKEKRNNTSVVLLLVGGILLVFILGTYIGYLLFKSIQHNDPTSKQNNKEVKETVTSLSVSDKQVYDLISIPNYTIQKRNSNDNYIGYFFKDNVDINNISDELKVFLATQKLKDSTWNENDSIILTTDKVDESMKEIFGDNVTYNNVSTNGDPCIYGNFVFDGTRYTHNKVTCDNIGLSYYDYKIISAIKYNDRIEITEKIAYYESQNNLKLIKKNHESSEVIASDENPKIDTYIDKLDSYKFTFNKVNDNYYLSKIEKM